MKLSTYCFTHRLGKMFATILLASVMTSTLFAQQGAIDLGFGTGGTGIYQDPLPELPLPMNPVDRARYFVASEVLPDGKVIVAGQALLQNSVGAYFGDFLVRRLNTDGSLDGTFGSGGEARTAFYRWGIGVGQQSSTPTYVLRVQPADGKIVVASACAINGVADPNTQLPLGNDLCLVRYNANGTVDTGFGGNTVMARLGAGATLYTMGPGRVWIQTGINEFNTDTIFGATGTPTQVRIAPDGKIYVFGSSQDQTAGNVGRFKGYVAILSPAGGLVALHSLADTSGNNLNGFGVTKIYDGEILSNGDYVAVGSQTTLVSTEPVVFSPPRWRVFAGSSGGGFLDGNVNAPGEARGITMTRNNKIWIAGNTVNTFGVPTLVRYNGNLTVDASFGAGGKILFDGTGNNLAIDTRWIGYLKTQSDGRVAGVTNNGNIARFNPNGSLDHSFARYREDVPDSLSLRGVLPWGRYITPFPVFAGADTRIGYGGIAIRSNGRIVTAGTVGEGAISGPSGRAVATQIKTYLRTGGSYNDLNNDGKTELAVFRPADGVWHQLESFAGNYSGSPWGSNGDKIAPADYDGDGKTDQAVFRNGAWYILQSSIQQLQSVQWGSPGDLPRPGDFNGDGYADIAVFRPSNGTWYILYSSPLQPGNITTATVQFGANGDAPLIADFDGDGRSDVAVFRNGTWYFLRSSNGSLGVVQFGSTGDIPVVGDYDADGKSDPAVFRNGVWYALRSQDTSLLATQFGLAGDRPVPGDYDNDGKNDLAIYRNGAWWVFRTSDNQVTGTNFGSGTDIPIPAAYIP